MKRNFKNSITLGLTVTVSGMILFTSCGTNESSPGVEYMPDMYRSPAIEAYVDYGQDPYYVGDSMMTAQNNTQSARHPVAGTIAFSGDRDMAWNNFPYSIPNTPEGYELASATLKNPLPLTSANFEDGKSLFESYCVHCHGDKGAGDGKIVTNGNFPPVPAYNTIDGLNEGKMFHTLTYGKGNMGSHASQITKVERWKIIHYITSLQKEQSFEEMGGMLDGAAVQMPGAEADSLDVPMDSAMMATMDALFLNAGDMVSVEGLEKMEGKDGQIYYISEDGKTVYTAEGRALTKKETKDLGFWKRILKALGFGKDKGDNE